MEKIRHRSACEIGFSDTDASGRAHFSRILVFVERAEHDFLQRAGLDVISPGGGGWPRVRVSCDYKLPLVFGDRIEVALASKKVGRSSLTWEFEIYKAGAEVAASGEMVTVKVDREGSPVAFTEAERSILEGAQ